ncbi:MAG: TetR/AcrR family transcriptional regulator [Bacillota bacterium]
MMQSDGRILKGEETLRKILESALVIISNKGLVGISAASVAQQAGVSKSNIFHHFKSVDNLSEAILKRVMESMEHSLDASKFKTVKSYLMALGEAIIQVAGEQLPVYRVFLSFYHESLFNENYRKMIDQFLELTKVKLISDLKVIIKDHLSDKLIQSIATLIITTLDGIGLHVLLGGSPKTYLEVWKLQVDSISEFIRGGFQ